MTWGSEQDQSGREAEILVNDKVIPIASRLEAIASRMEAIARSNKKALSFRDLCRLSLVGPEQDSPT